MTKPVVVLGLLGTTLDVGLRKRWNHWRPTVDLCRHEDLVVSRLELLHQARWQSLADTVAADIAGVSPETEVRSHLVGLDDPWDFEEVYGTLLDFTQSYAFRPAKEDYLVHITTGTHVAQISLFLLVEARRIPGRLIQTSPADKRKGGNQPGTYRIIDLDLTRYDRIASRFAREQRAGLSFLKQGIDTRNVAFNRLIERIEQVAIRSRSPILLTGPTGAGKTRLARRVYDLKCQRGQVEGSFVEVNCATLRGDGAMSALFGHAKGAFTGAVGSRKGLLLSAHRGAVFLDEIGELGRDEQAMLLRALEDKRFTPMGSDVEVDSDFQLIAGSNRDLRAAVADGVFREDLLARLDLWTFTLPGLAERPEDIEPNLEYELEGWAARHNVQVRFSREARLRFLEFATSREASWPGNFRDFAASIERMSTLAEGGRITLEGVREEIERLHRSWRRPTTYSDTDAGKLVLERALGPERLDHIDPFDRVQLTEVLRVCARSRSLSEAGRYLFASSRRNKTSTNDADRLSKYLAKHGLRWQDLPRTP
jgi:transcriptional regulatory protein RtcR